MPIDLKYGSQLKTIWHACGDFANKRVNEVSISNLENKVNDLTCAFFGLWKYTAGESL